jgi:hypothetical protein|tara:strand:- start:2657 stop:2920 length:264 start_codon:yes stop_codon:yes gene_type:complete
MREYFKKEVTSTKQAELFIDQLAADDLLYHPETYAKEVVDMRYGKRLFTDEEAIELDIRMDECYYYMDDPCAYILDNFVNDESELIN